MNQLYVCVHIYAYYIYIYIYTYSLLSLSPTPRIPPSRSQSPKLSSLYCTVDSQYLSYFTHGSVYILMLFSQFIPPSPSLPHPQVHSLHLHLYSCPANRFISIVFLESTHVCTLSCLTLCDLMDCSPPGFSVHEIFQARMLECVTISFSRGSSRLRDGTHLS